MYTHYLRYLISQEQGRSKFCHKSIDRQLLAAFWQTATVKLIVWVLDYAGQIFGLKTIYFVMDDTLWMTNISLFSALQSTLYI